VGTRMTWFLFDWLRTEKDTMTHTRVAVYQFKPGTIDESLKLVEKDLAPIYQEKPGFIRFDVIEASDNTVISITRWETSEQAELATSVAATFVKAHLAMHVVSMKNYVGSVRLSIAKKAPARA
jgi:quinol monooxygenase YgiN